MGNLYSCLSELVAIVQILKIKVLIATPHTTGVFQFCYRFYIKFEKLLYHRFI